MTTERQDAIDLALDAGFDHQDPIEWVASEDEIVAIVILAKAKGADEQKQSMLAAGWRQCAQGQGASQFCEQAEANRQEIERLTWTIEAAQAIWNKREKVLLDAWDDLLEDMELNGMHEFEPYKKSKEAFLRMKQK